MKGLISWVLPLTQFSIEVTSAGVWRTMIVTPSTQKYGGPFLLGPGHSDPTRSLYTFISLRFV